MRSGQSGGRQQVIHSRPDKLFCSTSLRLSGPLSFSPFWWRLPPCERCSMDGCSGLSPLPLPASADPPPHLLSLGSSLSVGYMLLTGLVISFLVAAGASRRTPLGWLWRRHVFKWWGQHVSAADMPGPLPFQNSPSAAEPDGVRWRATARVFLQPQLGLLMLLFSLVLAPPHGAGEILQGDVHPARSLARSEQPLLILCRWSSSASAIGRIMWPPLDAAVACPHGPACVAPSHKFSDPLRPLAARGRVNIARCANPAPFCCRLPPSRSPAAPAVAPGMADWWVMLSPSSIVLLLAGWPARSAHARQVRWPGYTGSDDGLMDDVLPVLDYQFRRWFEIYVHIPSFILKLCIQSCIFCSVIIIRYCNVFLLCANWFYFCLKLFCRMRLEDRFSLLFIFSLCSVFPRFVLLVVQIWRVTIILIG
jgi:hypothetical protein